MNNIFAIPAFSDNYIWCVHDGKHALVVDPGDAAPVIRTLKEQKLSLTYILITHHHYDHTGGVEALIAAYPDAVVYGPKNPKITGIDHRLAEGESLFLQDPEIELKILETPGHTMDHIVFYNDDLLFCGDTLFSAGCGRMFEGTPDVFYRSLQKLSQLPDKTKVYCTHEYTLANLAFASHVDPENSSLQEYQTWATAQRNNDQITLPSSIAKQKKINPFLRCDSKTIKQNIESIMNLSTNTEVEVFAALRRCKDDF
ncbi:hydroxyacylglutathione hydrolase [Brumicola nitratireducens]|uniref:Hydroxyacylglutathione hydrolase n=1 Tax=Glaciecola nitratireducens (strain JCM 12485 / KCTC 12276 / FR1064) TaxID=1085623 RepID=G4QEQ3_GLANF|nr:hydroxyacylglutathione hydrolase [Glaciecola nitratireducens]AEP29592.1 hydroxyacylglutathione hydrolase [Glaciecola nitratireducens FR1064]